jgi:Fe-S cluster biogenesis protein NfuA
MAFGASNRKRGELTPFPLDPKIDIAHARPTFMTQSIALIEAALDRIRPGLQLDGGDVRLIEVTPEGVVRVGLSGTCAGCPMSRMLLQCGIEDSLRGIPDITKVVTVDERVPK